MLMSVAFSYPTGFNVKAAITCQSCNANEAQPASLTCLRWVPIMMSKLDSSVNVTYSRLWLHLVAAAAGRNCMRFWFGYRYPRLQQVVADVNNNKVRAAGCRSSWLSHGP
jgi:hypothetical protein